MLTVLRRIVVLMFVVTLLGACASTTTSESAGEFLDSSLITAKVKSRLVDDPATSFLSISVVTYKGVVQLSGFVDSDKEKQRASELARSVEGVKEVKNDLVVKR
jgi:osmotically-inducible protein OsmY